MDRSHQKQQLLERAITLNEVDVAYFPNVHERWMTVWVDIVKHPTLAFLMNPQEEEYLYTFYTFEETTRDAIVIIHLRMQQSQTEFSLVFPAALYLKHLLLLAREGMLWIIPGSRPPHLSDREKDGDDPSRPGILIKLDQVVTRSLKEWLHAWREQRFDDA